MAKAEEGRIQSTVIRYAGRNGVRHIRLFFGRGMQTGWPDVLFLAKHGKSVFVEFKSLGKIPTPKQKIKIAALKALGHEVYVCDNVDYGKKIIDKLTQHLLPSEKVSLD